jgi:hypothetical protein
MKIKGVVNNLLIIEIENHASKMIYWAKIKLKITNK